MVLPIRLLDFDRSYQQQTFFQNRPADRLSLTDVPQSRRLCERWPLETIRARLAACDPAPVTFIGSNHYHYVTALLLQAIREPFVLVLFDHHADFYPSPAPDLISCGSWLRNVLDELPLLQQALVLGAGRDPRTSRLARRWGSRLVMVDEQQLMRDQAVKAFLGRHVAGRAVYVSIDKDVLDPGEAVTAWDQGHVRLDQLTGLIRQVRSMARLIGCDVCGEADLDPLTPPSLADQVLDRNNRANAAILDAIGKSGKL